MLTVGDTMPRFALKAVTSLAPGEEFTEITHASYPGKWTVLFFWPMDFTFVCPTEIAAFGRREADFSDRDTQLLGASTDTHFVHLAWRREHPDLRELPFPMLADTRRELSAALGVLHKDEGVPLRATFITDPQGVIRHVSVNDLSVGRSVDEVLRVLDALQTGELLPVQLAPGRGNAHGGQVMATLEALAAGLPAAARDIRLNLAATLAPGTLSAAQRWGVAAAAAYAARHPRLAEAIETQATAEAGEAVVEDARAAAALMAMNNVYYRFRHIVGKPVYETMPARLRMNRLASPATNRVDLELFSLAVSAINNCEACVRAHEQAVIAGGLTEQHVHEAVRIAATIHAAAVALAPAGAGVP